MTSAPLSISLLDRIVVTDDGEIVRITNMLDIAGDETSDPREAYSVVAGPMKDGKWIASTVLEDEREVILQ